MGPTPVGTTLERAGVDGVAAFTPEGVRLDVEPARLPSRLLARLLDQVIAGALVNVLSIPLAAVQPSEGLFVVVSLIALVLTMFVYPIVMEALTGGRTVGKMAVGLRVVTLTGGPVSVRHAVTRGLLSAVDLVASVGVVGIVAILTSSRSQRVGDMVAGTVVVRTRLPHGRQSTPPIDLGAFEAYVASLDPARIPVEERDLVEELSHRRTTPPLDHEQRLDRVADRIDARLHARPPGMTAEVFLACVAAADRRVSRSSSGLQRDDLRR